MRKVILSKRASNRLEKLLEYLETVWSLKVKQDFIKKLDKSLIQIQKYPESCQQTDFEKACTCLLLQNKLQFFISLTAKLLR
jgi:plasmid stabilization system protein ParE